MRIVHATITFPPAVGGMDRYVSEAAIALQDRGHDVCVLTTGLEQPMSRKRLHLPPGFRDPVPVTRFGTLRPPRLAFPVPVGMQRVLRSIAPDVVHAHCVWHSPAWIASRSGIPLVLHSVFSPRSGFFWRRYFRTVRLIVQRARTVIAISNFEKRLLEAAGLRPRRLEVIPPVVDLTEFRSAQPEPWSSLGIPPSRVILSVGRLAHGKRVDRIIDAMPGILERHPDAHLVIAGPDYGDETRLRERVRGQSLNGCVTFAGAVPEQQLAAMFQHARVFAMTTDFELFGIVLVEAMAAGAPVVAPDVAAVPEVIEPGRTGLLYPADDVGALAARVCRILSETELAADLRAAAFEAVRTRFEFGANMDRLEQIYRD